MACCRKDGCQQYSSRQPWNWPWQKKGKMGKKQWEEIPPKTQPSKSPPRSSPRSKDEKPFTSCPPILVPRRSAPKSQDVRVLESLWRCLHYCMYNPGSCMARVNWQLHVRSTWVVMMDIGWKFAQKCDFWCWYRMVKYWKMKLCTEMWHSVLFVKDIKGEFYSVSLR